MQNDWTHPQLGVLVREDNGWRREITVPSFRAFSYIDVAVRSRRSHPNPFELILQCESENDLPNGAMASLAVTILDNESRLVPRLLEGLWMDLNGRGPDSGVWWHGDLSTAFEQFDELQLPIPKSPAELRAILEPKNLTIRRDFSSPKAWVREFNFHAAFDVEHGVGILTDGVDVLGIGYSSDATRFGGDGTSSG